MRRLLLITIMMAGIVADAHSQTIPKSTDLRELCDSLTERLYRRTGTRTEVKLKKVLKSGSLMNFYFNEDLSFHPWRSEDIAWFREELAAGLKEKNCSLGVGTVYAKAFNINDLALPVTGSDGKPTANSFSCNDPRLSSINRFITRTGEHRYPKGLSDRYIALWQSHGRYFNEKKGSWIWQRAPLHRTVEDMYTQSYVLPFLIPMLENAGAYVMTPRERDIQRNEIICDGDRTFERNVQTGCRTEGKYAEKGKWEDAGEGFADTRMLYAQTDNPFKSGSSRKTGCSPDAKSEARWTPDIPERGRYAVYVSYMTFPQSTTDARYAVHHMGGVTEFKVNQKRGGGMWIYLGTFEFDKGTKGYVTLDNSGKEGNLVSADAVKFGGGYGKVERGGNNSGLPAYAEGALYSMPWYGIDQSVFMEKDDDYHRDYYSRGVWVNWLKKEKGIPFDASVAFHSDAGAALNDTIIGTLAIHTLYSEGSRKYGDGRDRMSARLMADMVQTQVVEDIRAKYDPQWSRRGIWNKSYAECRIPDVPSMILETLSHQNLADMKHGLDPAFRFDVSRAVYKGLLKFLSSIYGCEYEVQPLPVNSFSARFAGTDKSTVRLQWRPSDDPLEPTAKAEGYRLFTRIDGGAWDSGDDLNGTTCTRPIVPGHIYSYKIVAYNEGGCSFPSEILSVGCPEGHESDRPVLIVNNFDRVSAPSSFDEEGRGGFLAEEDSGVPYLNDISYIGENYEFCRELPWVSDEEPGFGASHTDKAGMIIAGNTFDFPYGHGRDMMSLGMPFCSVSRDAFIREKPSPSDFRSMDLICGKQARTVVGAGHVSDRYEVFPKNLEDALTRWAGGGGSILMSGSAIASDCGNDDSFISDVLGFRSETPKGSETGSLSTSGITGRKLTLSFRMAPNPTIYSVESPDALSPSGLRSHAVLKYQDTGLTAATLYHGSGYKVYAIGVPLECLEDEEARLELMRKIFESL